jgi:hypothetical protein
VKTSSFTEAGIENKFPVAVYMILDHPFCAMEHMGKKCMQKYLWKILTYGDCLENRGLDGRVTLNLI